MNQGSAAFDRLVEHIAALLRNAGREVTSLDQTLDPDDPDEPRAVDMTVRDGSALTLLELRDHRMTDHASWFSMLAAKRRNTRADAAIAITAGPVSQTEERHAVTSGIILRPMTGLSDDEIGHWGGPASIAVTRIAFRSILLHCTVDPERVSEVRPEPTVGSERGAPYPISDIVTYLRKAFAERLTAEWTRWKVEIADHHLLLDGVPVRGLTIVFDAKLEKTVQDLYSVVAYTDPQRPLGPTGPVRNIIADLTGVAQPENTLLHHVAFDLCRPGEIGGTRIVGSHAVGQSRFDVIALKVAPAETAA